MLQIAFKPRIHSGFNMFDGKVNPFVFFIILMETDCWIILNCRALIRFKLIPSKICTHSRHWTHWPMEVQYLFCGIWTSWVGATYLNLTTLNQKPIKSPQQPIDCHHFAFWIWLEAAKVRLEGSTDSHTRLKTTRFWRAGPVRRLQEHCD